MTAEDETLFNKALTISDDNLGVSEDFIITNRFACARFIVDLIESYHRQEMEGVLEEAHEEFKRHIEGVFTSNGNTEYMRRQRYTGAKWMLEHLKSKL